MNNRGRRNNFRKRREDPHRINEKIRTEEVRLVHDDGAEIVSLQVALGKARDAELDLVEISPAFEKGKTTIIHAERLICNLIGAMVRANYFK